MPPKSILWQHYTRNPDQSGTCRHCGNNVKTKGNTSNLKCHLQSKHHKVFEVFSKSLKEDSKSKKIGKLTRERTSPNTSTLDPNLQNDIPNSSNSLNTYQDTISGAFKKIESFKEGGSSSQKITQAIIYMICKDCQPLSLVEHPGFCKLMKILAPHFKIPSRFTIKRMINEKYDMIKDVMKKKLEGKKCTLTTDIWTDDLQTRSFISLTVHFYDEGLDNFIFSGTIGVFMLEDRHTAVNLAAELKKICSEWGISDEQVIAIVTDNAANISLAIEIAFGTKKHIPCFAHTLNLVIEKSVELCEETGELIKKVKTIVTWFKHSVLASGELKKKTDKKLIQSVITRWNSVYYMLERFLELRPFVNEIINQHSSAPPMVSAADIEILTDIVNIIQPIEAATTEISGHQYVTGSMAIPVSNITKSKIDAVNVSTQTGRLFLKEVRTQFQKRFGNIEQVNLLAISTIMDPRFKKMYFNNPAACAKHINFLSSVVNKMDQEMSGKRLALATDTSSSDSESEQKQHKAKSLFSDHNKNVQKKWKRHEDLSEIQPLRMHSELSLYLGKKFQNNETFFT